ncbi:unnamed protein product, partial [Meganyctiphanes norvegica]
RGANMNLQDIDGETALHEATKKNHNEEVIALLKGGIDATLKTNAGETAEDIAKRNGFTNILTLIKQYTETTLSAVVMDATTSGTVTSEYHMAEPPPNTLFAVVICLAVGLSILLIFVLGLCIYSYKLRSRLQQLSVHRKAIHFTAADMKETETAYDEAEAHNSHDSDEHIYESAL